MEIVFVLAPSQNRFFFEMVDALVFELRELGVQAALSTTGFPARRGGLVYAVFPPHEYFVLEGHDQAVDPELLKRTIFISAEQPSSTHFAENLRLAQFAGRVFDINASAVRAYQRAGVAAELIQLGYSRHFDRFKAEQEASVDAVFMGCITPRRARHLAGCARTLSSLDSRIVLSDNSRPNSAGAPNFVTGEDKLQLLSSAAVLLNIHQTDDPYFEWARILDAIHCGAVVLTEHSTDHLPLVPGEHFVSCRPEALPLMLEKLHGDPELRGLIRRNAYDTIRSELPLSEAAARLAGAAEDLDRCFPVDRAGPTLQASVDAVTHIDFAAEAARYRPQPGDLFRPDAIFPESDPELAAIRRVLKELRLDMMDLRRAANRNALIASGDPPPLVRQVVATPAYALRSKPRVTILTAMYNHGNEIVEALDSLLESRFGDWEAVVVDDGSTDASATRVAGWAQNHPDVALRLLSHPVNRGLGHARNTALDYARGEYLFVLDADNAVYPNCLGDLVTALDEHPKASFSYGILASFRDYEPHGLVSFFPWEPPRLRHGNYIDAMALFRSDIVRQMGGYATDRRLYGWEDYDLYCRMAELGYTGLFLDRIVASYRSSPTSMLAVSNISHSAAYVALKERAPTLMDQVVVPD